jgi:hypothetical protein
VCSLQQCRREVQAARTCTLCYRETAIRLYDPPTPALRSCPGSCRCVGSPALKKVKSDEQCTAAAPLSPTGTICVHRSATLLADHAHHRDSAEPCGLSGPGNDSQLCTHRNSRVVHTLLYIRESLVAASSSCPSRSDSLFLSGARRHMDAYMSHFGAARRSPRSAHHVCLSSRKTTPPAR